MSPSAAQPSPAERAAEAAGGSPRAAASRRRWRRARRPPRSRPRVALITDIPTPYRDPLLARIHRRPELELDVTFCARSFVDRDWQLPAVGFPARVLARRGFVTRGETVLTHLVQPEIVGLLRRTDPDLVVVSSFAQPTSLMAIATARAIGAPYMVVCESHARRQRPRLKEALRAPLLRQVLGHAAGGFPVGTLAREYLASFGVPRERLYFFPNTPDTRWFRAESVRSRAGRDETRAALGTPPGALVAIYVGRLLAIKAVDTLLSAWARVRASFPGAALWIAGDGPERRALEAAAGEGVHFLGYRQQHELPSLYAAADAFVLPSRDEPWGVVVNEAAATSLPLVTSDRVGASADLIIEGETGRTFPAGDAAALAAALESIWALPDRGRAMGEAASRLVDRWGYDFAEAEFVRGVLEVLGAERER